MSSLRTQLRKQAENANFQNKIYSYMYDAQTASRRTVDEIYGMGLNGLLQLSLCDPRFNHYKDTVFSISHKGVPADNHTAEELSEIDREITHLCYLMGPFFLQRSTESAESLYESEKVSGSVPKVIEYLIRNFGANLRPNTVDALLACALPYHETAAFGRLIGVLSLSGKWEWLLPNAKVVRPVSAEAYATQCRTDKSLLRWTAETARDMHEQGLLSRQYACFVAAIATGVLSWNNVGTVGKRTVEILLPLVIDGLKLRQKAGDEPSDRNISLIAELICAQLGKYTNFTEKTLASLAAMAIRGADEKNFETRGVAVVSMIENQHAVYGTDAKLPLSTLKRFVVMRDRWLDLVVSLANRGMTVGNFVIAVFDMVLNHGIVATAGIESLNEENYTLMKAGWEFIRGVIAQVKPLDAKVSFHIARSLLALFDSENAEANKTKCETEIRSTLVLMSAQHPDSLDKAIDAALKANTNDSSSAAKEWLFKFLGSTFSGTVHQPLPTGEVLALAVSHPVASVRESAMERISEMRDTCANSTEFREFVLSTIAERLKHEDTLKVLEKTLALDWAISSTVDGDSQELSPKVREIFDTLVDRTLASDTLSPALAEHAIALLSAAFAALTSKCDSAEANTLALRVICAFWPHYLQRDSVDEAFVSGSSKFNVGGDHFFFKCFAVSAKKTPAKRGRSRKSVMPAAVNAAKSIADALVENTEEMLGVIDATFACEGATTMGKLLSFVVLTKALSSSSSSSGSKSKGANVQISANMLGHIEGEFNRIFIAFTKGGNSAMADDSEDNYEMDPAVMAKGEVSDGIAAICKDSKDKNPHVPAELLVGMLGLVLDAIPAYDSSSASEDGVGEAYYSVFSIAAKLPLNVAAPLVSDIVFDRIAGDRIEAYRFLIGVITHRGATQQAQIRALNVISASLDKAGKVPEDVALLVLPYVFVAVQSAKKFVRNAALTLLSVIATREVPAAAKFITTVARGFDSARVELLAEVDFFTGICAQIASGKSFSGADVARADIAKFVALLVEEASKTRDYAVAHSLLVPAATLSPTTALERTYTADLLTKAMAAGKEGRRVARLLLGLYGADKTCDVVNKTPSVMGPFINALDDMGAKGYSMDAIARVPGYFWAGLDNANKETVFKHLIEIAALGSNIAAKVAARNAVSALAPLPPALLEPYLSTKEEEKKKGEEKTPLDEGRDLALVDTVLEVIADRAGNWSAFCKHLIKRVFDVIRTIVDTPASAAREYTLQIALTTLARITVCLAEAVRTGAIDNVDESSAAVAKKSGSGSSASGLPPMIVSSKKRQAAAGGRDSNAYEEYYDIALVTRCMRTASSPQVHVQSLSLLAAAAPLIPQAIMRNVVDILSFIATSAMTQDDSATFNVLGKTIEAIVPPMLSTSTSSSSSGTAAGMSGAAPLVRTLVSGFSSIPQHRRLLLFQTVVNTISPESLGFVCIALLHLLTTKQQQSRQEVEAAEAEEEEASIVLAFAHKLCLSFTPECAVAALNELVNFALALSKKEPIVRWAPYCGEGKGAVAVPAQIARTCLTFVESHVSGREFVEAVVSEPEAARAAAEPQFLTLFESVVRVVNEAGRIKAGLTGSAAVGIARNTLSALKNALSVPTFVKAVSRLLQSKNEATRRTGLLLLNDKLADIGGAIRDSEAALFVGEDGAGLLGLVVRMLGSGESAASRQTALLTLEILARSLAARYPDSFESLLASAVESLEDADDNVVSSALICVATFVSELRAMSIAHLPRFMPCVLSRLDAALKSNASSSESAESVAATTTVGGDERLMSTLSALMVIVRHVADFLSPYAAQVMTLLLHPALVGSAGKAAAVASNVLESLTEKVEARLLLGPIFEVFASKAITSAASLVRLFDVVREVSARMKPQAVATHYKHLLKFFLEGAFDFRDKYADTFDAADMKLVEDHIIEAFLQLVMKLNENMFKPLFLKVNDFFQQKSSRKRGSSESGGNAFGAAERDAAIFYTRILKALAENLRGIFVPFYGFFVDYLLEHLSARDSADFVRANAELESGRTGKHQRKRKRQHGEIELEAIQEKEYELDAAALDTLAIGFTYDTQGFADSAFNKLAAIGDQLENYALGTERYVALMGNNLTPCLAQMAAALGRNKKECWKALNHQLLLHLRNDAPEVRRATLQTLTAIWQKIGEEIDVVLPETVPYLSEALQDSSAEVEAAANDFAEVIQSYLGEESLRDYF